VSEDLTGYFQRGEVTRLEWDMREGLLDDWHFAQMLRDSIRLGRAPRIRARALSTGGLQLFRRLYWRRIARRPHRFIRSAEVHPSLISRARPVTKPKEQSI